MKIFLDTANIEDIKKAVDWQMIDGATTNPTLMARESGRKFEDIAKEICRLVPGPVSLEGVGMTAAELVKEGKKLSTIAKNVVFKVPMTPEGLKAVRELKKQGIKTNVTLVFSANQALLVAKAGADYCSPFIGRLDDIGQNGWELLDEIIKIYRNYKFKTQILAASIRSTIHVKQAAYMGCDVATIPFKILEQMYHHELTDKGIKLFLDDWQKVTK
jgi:transaldolase